MKLWLYYCIVLLQQAENSWCIIGKIITTNAGEYTCSIDKNTSDHVKITFVLNLLVVKLLVSQNYHDTDIFGYVIYSYQEKKTSHSLPKVYLYTNNSQNPQ